MEEYPRTLREFEALFSGEGACREYLFVCVADGSSVHVAQRMALVGKSGRWFAVDADSEQP